MAKKDIIRGINYSRVILVEGPECSGKTHLCEFLSDKYGAYHLKEYAVEYLNHIQRPYEYSDIAKIAVQHYQRYLGILCENDIVVLDSFMMNLKIWSLYKYGKVDPEIEKIIRELKFDSVLLMKPNIPWEMAPYRENPDDRMHLYEMYVDQFKTMAWNYEIVDQLGADRFLQAENLIIDKLVI